MFSVHSASRSHDTVPSILDKCSRLSMIRVRVYASKMDNIVYQTSLTIFDRDTVYLNSSFC